MRSAWRQSDRPLFGALSRCEGIFESVGLEVFIRQRKIWSNCGCWRADPCMGSRSTSNEFRIQNESHLSTSDSIWGSSSWRCAAQIDCSFHHWSFGNPTSMKSKDETDHSCFKFPMFISMLSASPMHRLANRKNCQNLGVKSIFQVEFKLIDHQTYVRQWQPFFESLESNDT